MKILHNNNRRISLFFVIVFSWANIASAQLTGDPASGATLAETCAGCHGIPGYSNATPNYKVPKVGGQYPQYIDVTLGKYIEGNRQHGPMRANAFDLSAQDRADIAAYFGQYGSRITLPFEIGDIPNMTEAQDIQLLEHVKRSLPNTRNPELQVQVAEQVKTVCSTCHGLFGQGLDNIPTQPIIGGQHASYMAQQMKNFRAAGSQAETLMYIYVGEMDDALIDALAEYYANQPSRLNTIPKSRWN